MTEICQSALLQFAVADLLLEIILVAQLHQFKVVQGYHRLSLSNYLYCFRRQCCNGSIENTDTMYPQSVIQKY
jgi:uncharacterized membrane protein